MISIIVSEGSMLTPGVIVEARPLNNSESSYTLSERMIMSIQDLLSPTSKTKSVGGGE